MYRTLTSSSRATQTSCCHADISQYVHIHKRESKYKLLGIVPRHSTCSQVHGELQSSPCCRDGFVTLNPKACVPNPTSQMKNASSNLQPKLCNFSAYSWCALQCLQRNLVIAATCPQIKLQIKTDKPFNQLPTGHQQLSVSRPVHLILCSLLYCC